MGIAVNLNTGLVKEAKRHSLIERRSASKQIEYWAAMGKIAEENPDLSFNDIKEILLALEEVRNGNMEVYDPDNL